MYRRNYIITDYEEVGTWKKAVYHHTKTGEEIELVLITDISLIEYKGQTIKSTIHRFPTVIYKEEDILNGFPKKDSVYHILKRGRSNSTPCTNS